MSRPSKAPLWRWRRAIARADEELWQERLGAEAGWMIVEKPGRIRLSVEVYFPARAPADRLARRWGGRVEKIAATPPPLAAPVHVSRRLEIVHEARGRRRAGQLLIPYGIAFGSGEHATTLMLLRALAARRDLDRMVILDLGTGSGVLALAARELGARQVAGSDFDPNAIRTARENERLNFGSRRIRWQVADACQLRAQPACALILANLYSEILIEAAPRITRRLRPGGEAWLSGVLRSQAAEVAAAYDAAGLRHLATRTRGKWVMQQWSR